MVRPALMQQHLGQDLSGFAEHNSVTTVTRNENPALNRWVVWEFCPQEGACEIPVPKWSHQGDDLVSHLKKTIKFWKIQIQKPALNFENSNLEIVKFW